MAPLSVLPGRLRLETDRLIGSRTDSLFLEVSLRSMPGVIEASASHRTGRLLVRFDESTVSRSEIEGHLDLALQADVNRQQWEQEYLADRRNTGPLLSQRSGLGNFVMEAALHAFLPAPLDLLLPLLHR